MHVVVVNVVCFPYGIVVVVLIERVVLVGVVVKLQLVQRQLVQLQPVQLQPQLQRQLQLQL